MVNSYPLESMGRIDACNAETFSKSPDWHGRVYLSSMLSSAIMQLVWKRLYP